MLAENQRRIENNVKYRITSYEALVGNLAAAGAMIVLCRANIGRLGLDDQEKEDVLRRTERLIAELDAMRLELSRPAKRRRLRAKKTCSL